MNKKKQPTVLSGIRVDKLVHGGQGIATVSEASAEAANKPSMSGSKIFVWNALPGELVDVQVTKKKRSYLEGYASTVHEPSKQRIEELAPDDIAYSVSPWEIVNYTAELSAKDGILQEAFAREGVELQLPEMKTFGGLRSYRNKIEFSFWGDNEGLHFAHYVRATHRKIKLKYPYSHLIPDQLAVIAEVILTRLNDADVRASDLKSLVLRCDRRSPIESKVTAALFVKTQDFPDLQLQDAKVIYSNPLSPASVVTEVLHEYGSTNLVDDILGQQIHYDVLSFFQVNIPIFEQALEDIKQYINGRPSVDMYSGVGSIGIAVGSDVLVEVDEANVIMAKQNVTGTSTQVVHAASEQAVEHIVSDKILIVDPPRAGLHANVIEQIHAIQPPAVVYLSCNASTQARDVALLAETYAVVSVQGYNFFPRTPHIESLIILERK